MDNLMTFDHNGEILQLTQEQEIEILKGLVFHSYLGAGSSRAVYEYGDSYVVKIAASIHGRKQNMTEVDRYRAYKYKGFLAPIYAYGEYIIIMAHCEEMEVYGSSEAEDLRKEWSAFLDDSTDGVQAGLFEGKLVFYDYGYENCRDEQVGDMTEWVDNYDIPSYTLGLLRGEESELIASEDGYSHEDSNDPYNHYEECICDDCRQAHINGWDLPDDKYEEKCLIEDAYEDAKWKLIRINAFDDLELDLKRLSKNAESNFNVRRMIWGYIEKERHYRVVHAMYAQFAEDLLKDSETQYGEHDPYVRFNFLIRAEEPRFILNWNPLNLMEKPKDYYVAFNDNNDFPITLQENMSREQIETMVENSLSFDTIYAIVYHTPTTYQLDVSHFAIYHRIVSSSTQYVSYQLVHVGTYDDAHSAYCTLLVSRHDFWKGKYLQNE